MKIDMDLQGVDGVLATLKSLPPEVVSKRGGPVKLALAKGARELRDEAKKNLRAAIAINGDESSGLLEKNVIASRGKPPIGVKGERYLVRVKRKRYPGRRASTHQTANFLEYGTSHQPATPWLRPAVQSKGQKVINTVIADLVKRVDKVVQKLAIQNKGR